MNPPSDLPPLPRHVAIIPDGNRRWAKEHGLSTLIGHQRGMSRFRELCQLALDQQIEAVSFWGFSTENWKRAEDEVGYLMTIIEQLVRKDGAEMIEQGAKLRFSGRMDDLPVSLRRAIQELVAASAGNDRTTINICLSYGGRDELVRVVKKFLDEGVSAADVTEKMISSVLDTAGLPDLDLVIRTSGEQRLSGFMPWQSTYAELYFPPLKFPDFTKEEFQKALDWSAARPRRFGQ